MNDSADKPLYAPRIDGRLHTLMTIRKRLQKQLTELIQELRESVQRERTRIEHASKVHDQTREASSDDA